MQQAVVNETRARSIAAASRFLVDLRRRLRLLGRVAFVGFWLGVLDRRTLHAIDDLAYRRWRPLYQNPEYNRRGLFEWEREAIESYFPDRGRLTVIGAGGGREVLALSAMGYDVAGVECNRVLIEAANRLLREAGSGSTVSWLPRDAAPRDRGRLDGVIVGWGAYTLMVGRKRRIRFLRGLAESLASGAPVLISFYTWNGRLRHLRWIHLVATTIRRVLRREPVEPGDDLAPNFIHHFTAQQVEQELREGGYELCEFREHGAGIYNAGFAVGIRS
jgi:hypothetical protein